MEISLPDELISLQKNISLTMYVDFRLRGLLYVCLALYEKGI